MSNDAKGKNDAELTIILGLIVGVMMIALFWWMAHDPIVIASKILRIGEWKLVQLFGGAGLDKVADAGMREVAGTRVKGAEWDTLTAHAYKVMQYLRWPFGGIMALIGIWTLMTTPGARHRKRYDLERLLGAQAKTWPVISPMLKFNPAKHSDRAPGAPLPSRLPIFAEALNPHEWLALHRVPVFEAQIDRDACRRSMVRQLGARWRGPAKLPDHQRALFAAFALKGLQKRQESDELLGEIAKCWSFEGGLKLTAKLKARIDKIIADPQIGGEALKMTERHAFVSTALLRTLSWARERGGVLAPASFLWLRGVERRLWYPLNNLGRRAFHAEASGAMAHYMCELAANKPLPTPKLDAAIMAVEDYIAAWGGDLPQLQDAPAKSAATLAVAVR